MALATGHPVIAGFGPGAPAFQQNLLGAPYAKPLAVARQYLTAVRRLLGGGVVETDGPEYTFRAQLAPAAAPRVDVGLGVLRPGMARLAGEVADTVITWLTPPDPAPVDARPSWPGTARTVPAGWVRLPAIHSTSAEAIGPTGRHHPPGRSSDRPPTKERAP